MKQHGTNLDAGEEWRLEKRRRTEAARYGYTRGPGHRELRRRHEPVLGTVVRSGATKLSSIRIWISHVHSAENYVTFDIGALRTKLGTSGLLFMRQRRRVGLRVCHWRFGNRGKGVVLRWRRRRRVGVVSGFGEGYEWYFQVNWLFDAVDLVHWIWVSLACHSLSRFYYFRLYWVGLGLSSSTGSDRFGL